MNTSRRNFLKLLVLGGGFSVAGAVLGPSVIDFMSGRRADTIDQENISTFKVVEENGELRIFSKDGQELFVIDNGE